MDELYQQQSNRTELLRAALGYSAKGIPVFPCKPAPDKSPMTKRGFYDATTSRPRITGYWKAFPHASIGMPTGERSGFFVLDEDRPGALDELEEKMGKLPPTLTIRTPRGGRHLYFRYEEGITNRTGSLPEGIDVRGEGGYALVPPSTGYTVEHNAPVAEPPEWLLEALREPQKPESSRGKKLNPTLVSAVGESIPDGKRNVTLTSIAGKYHDGTRSRDQLATLLLDINARRCPTPLEDTEIEKIATSIHRREPCKQSAPKAGAEVLEALGGFEAACVRGQTWKGQRWATPRSALVSLILEARSYGREVKDGVFVSMSVRKLALKVGVGRNAIIRSGGALDKLKDAGLIRSTAHQGTKSGGFILLTQPSVAREYHSSTDKVFPSSGITLPRPPTGPRLRYSKPVFERVDGKPRPRRVDTIRRLGKTSEKIVDILEYAGGWMSVAELGAALGIKNHRDLRRRALARLREASVVEWSGDAVRLRLDWRNALDRRREGDQEIEDYERDRKRYEEQSRNYRVIREAGTLYRMGMDPDEIAAAMNLDVGEVRSVLDLPYTPSPASESVPEPDGLIVELERVEDQAKPLSDLAVAVRDYLDLNPHRGSEPAGWIANTLWAYDLASIQPGAPGREAVKAALEELADVGVAA